MKNSFDFLNSPRMNTKESNIFPEKVEKLGLLAIHFPMQSVGSINPRKPLIYDVYYKDFPRLSIAVITWEKFVQNPMYTQVGSAEKQES